MNDWPKTNPSLILRIKDPQNVGPRFQPLWRDLVAASTTSILVAFGYSI
jgi:hypothetical protein